jgi:hypothetical protein
MLRVWLPPTWDLVEEAPRTGGYPVVFLHDAQNLFTPDLCFSGSCWQVGKGAHRNRSCVSCRTCSRGS